MSNQPVIGFEPLPTRRTTLLPRPATSPKRGRAPTTSDTAQPSLPPHRRPAMKAPKLKPTSSYMFKGLHPLYIQKVVENQHDHMSIHCSQPGCSLAPKIINRSLSGTNNYKLHYQKYHPGIPLSEKEEKDMAIAKRAAKHPQAFFEKPSSDQTHNETF